MKTLIKIATRKSPLALWQTHFVQQQLKNIYPKLQFEMVELSTEGDRTTHIPLNAVGGKGLFVKELQQQVLLKHADIAVHSCKDLSAQETPGLTIAAFCKRADPRDAFLSSKYHSITELPINACVGTSSPRRELQLKAIRSDLQIIPLRGNINTRIEKLAYGNQMDAIILAVAGLQRLNLTSYIREYLSPAIFLPAIGQGIIAVECLSDNTFCLDLLAEIDDLDTRRCAVAERAVNQRLGGDCYTPLAAYAVLDKNQLCLEGMLGNLATQKIIHAKLNGLPNEGFALGTQLAEQLMEREDSNL